MMLHRIVTVTLVGAFLLLAGCRSAPVYEVVNAPVVSTKGATLPQIQEAIMSAGQSLGWQMVPQGQGKILGTLALRGHRAVVEISYDAKSYSIKYKDSDNLHYDGNSIHKNYNGWIHNLDSAIRSRLA